VIQRTLVAAAKTLTGTQANEPGTIPRHHRLQENSMHSPHESRHLTPASRATERARRITSVAFIGCTALVMCWGIDLRADVPSPQDVLERFLAAPARRTPLPYRAFRRLEASSAKMKASGWVEALTEFDLEAGLRYQVLAEEGTGRIRGVLKGVLDGERQAMLPGKTGSAAMTRENYEFEPGVADENGLVPVRLKPRRREATLIDGTIYVTAEGADLVRVEGRLAKSPSFWTRSVDIVRRYERRAGRVVLVEVRSVADVKVIGPSEFVMRYEYESVNGEAAHDGPPKILASRFVNAPSPK